MPPRSTSAIAKPRLASASAIEVPTMPAPSTMASVRAMGLPFAVQGRMEDIWIAAPKRTIKAPPGNELSAMNVLQVPVAALAAVGRNGTRWLAGAVFVGMALQPLGPLVKPYLGAVVFVMLLFSYLRTDPVALARHMRSPGLVAAATLWVMIGAPLIFGAVYTLSGLPAQAPGLYQILILQIAIAPITSSAAYAALMGLDVALSLMTLIVTSALCPITTVALSYYFLG